MHLFSFSESLDFAALEEEAQNLNGVCDKCVVVCVVVQGSFLDGTPAAHED